MAWQLQGACRDEDPEIFFPVGTNAQAQLQTDVAKGICRRCSVVDECLAFAVAHSQESGIWGGLSEQELRLRRRAVASRSA